MRIKRVKLYVVNVPETHWWWSDDYYGQPAHQRADQAIAEVETDEGLTGLTEIERGYLAPGPATRDSPAESLEALLRSWLAQDVLEVNLAGTQGSSTGSFEQAILDIRGQALGVPIWQLLGGRLRDRVFVTQCTGYKTPEHTAEDARRGWDMGFRAYKMKAITQREKTPEERIRYVVDRVEAIHRVLPDMSVRPDVRWRLREVWVAQELARRLEGHLVDCLESPIEQGAAAGTYSEWRRLRQTMRLPIADHVSPYRPLQASEDLIRRFQAEALDYAIVGGAGHLDTLDQSRLAHQLGMGGWGQTVALGPGSAMGLHVAACLPNLTQPYDIVGPMAWENTLVNEEFPFVGGCFLVPDGPGLGYTLNHETVGKYLIREQVFDLD